MNVSDKLLQLTCWCLCLKVFDFRLPVRSNVHIQLLLLTFGVHHSSAGWQQEGTQPQRVNLKQHNTCRRVRRSVHSAEVQDLAAEFTCESYVYVLMEACDGSLQVLHGYQHVLHHVVLFVKSPDGLSLGELQQWDLGRDHPPKQPAEHRVVAERDNILGKSDRYTQAGFL